jgi:hypothetical protein
VGRKTDSDRQIDGATFEEHVCRKDQQPCLFGGSKCQVDALRSAARGPTAQGRISFLSDRGFRPGYRLCPSTVGDSRNRHLPWKQEFPVSLCDGACQSHPGVAMA